MPPGRPALFLDRDGTIIEDKHYLHDPGQVVLLPGAAEGITRFNAAGWPVIIISNQSGIGRKLITEDQLRSIMVRLHQELDVRGARITAAYHCPHTPDEACDCRKPSPGLFLRAAEEHGLDLASSLYVGDRLRDVEPGLDLGGRGFLLRHGEDPGRDPPPGLQVVTGIEAVADLVLGKGTRSL